MKVSNTVKEYFAALNRLKQNNPVNIAKGSLINKDSVALEAGRKRGSIRNRPGFETLIAEIDAAEILPRTKARKRNPTNPKQKAEIEQLKRDLDIARSRYMSLLYLNAEMAKTIRRLGGDVPKFGEVTNIVVTSDSTDIPY
ncbi:MAG: hypothetical protein P1U47_17200 [Zhongshania sp.]|uniref:hypothetical protein n=1 Tax=Zhongshania sp. TaxID=1971902 RepID=UPI0026186AC2|nr:hypothetical protein [Zhongshania sp.]MDF1694110.1 hypothetical protein [Zhongshania sp.]